MDCLKINNSVQELYNYAANNDCNAVYSARDFYSEGIKNPSLALLIARNKCFSYYTDLASNLVDYSTSDNWKIYMSNTLLNLFQLKENIEKAKQHPLVQEHQDKFIKEATETLYPTSAATRLALISRGQIVLDSITPKVRGLKKLLLIREIKKCANDVQKYARALL